ncbi:MAG: hypothetical protein ACI8QT_000596 [Halioglobus sp.]|jgi:hypothetical protein
MIFGYFLGKPPFVFMCFMADTLSGGLFVGAWLEVGDKKCHIAPNP